MGKFDNKVVVITGSGQGIGRCLALTYAKEGAHVVIVELDAEAGEEVHHMISKPESLFVKTDIGDEKSVINLFERVKEKFGKVDILINNAVHGTWMCDIMDEKSIEIFEKVINVNIKGTYMMVKYCLPLMLRPKQDTTYEYLPGPNIINIGSTRSLMSEPNTEPYTASKGAITSMTHGLAVSLAKYRIRVNCVSPGWIDVSNWKKQSVAKQAEIKKEDHEQHPVGRVGVPEDIASACMYFSHEDAGFVTGQNLFVDGGNIMSSKLTYMSIELHARSVDFRYLAQLASIRELSLYDALCDDNITALTNLEKLTVTYGAESYDDSLFLAALPKLTTLRSLNYTNTNKEVLVTKIDLSPLTNMERLLAEIKHFTGLETLTNLTSLTNAKNLPFWEKLRISLT